MDNTNLTPEQAIEKIGSMFEEKSATFSTKEELEAASNEMKSQIESLKGLEEKNADIEKAIARFEGRLESFNEKATVVPKKKQNLSEAMFNTYESNLDSIKSAVTNGGKVQLEVKADTTITNDYTGTYALTDFDPEVDRIARKRYGILENVSTGQTTGKFVTYVTMGKSVIKALSSDDDKGYVAEAGAKLEGEPQWEEISEEVKKIACYVKVSKEMLEDLSFIRGEINLDLMESLRNQIEQTLLSGVGGVEINGLLTPGIGLPAFGAGTFANAIPNANITDLIRVVKAQIEGANFTPTHIVLNPEDIAKLQLTKGTDGTYTYPMYLPTQSGDGEMVVAGMRVISSTYMSADEYLIGDLSRVQVRFREDIGLTVGLDTDDFTRNMVTILAEARLVQYVKNNDKNAFVFGTISTDVTAITAP
mgnify:CR=1 FL=1